MEALDPTHVLVQRLDRDLGGGRPGRRIRFLRGMRWFRFAFVIALAVGRPTPALAAPTEHEVKAALLFNITRFVEWPAAAFSSPSAPLVVTIIGHDDMSDVLERVLLDKRVNGHPLEVRHVLKLEEIPKCHVLYVASSEQRRAAPILKALRGTNTLTVADFEHFAERGGHVNLVVDDQRVHVFVNPTSALESHLTIGARLLSLAQIVGTTP